MAEIHQASIIWVDAWGQSFSMTLGPGTTAIEAALVYHALVQHSNARQKAIQETITYTPDPVEIPPNDQEYSTVDQRAVISLYEHGFGLSKSIQLPAPKLAIFDEVMKEGKRVLVTPGQAIADAIGDNVPAGPRDKSEPWTVGAGTWEFVQGYLKSVR